MKGEDALRGVRFLDHTADVGIDVEAETLPALFHRAAMGMLALLRGEDDPPPRDPPPRPTTGPRSAPGPPAEPTEPLPLVGSGSAYPDVLHAWLRELLFLHDTGRDFVSADFTRLDDTGFQASVRVVPARGAVREIKGVTYHGLGVDRTDTGWRARIIFDV